MKKSVLIVDFLLIIALILIIISKITPLGFIRIVQPIFFVLIIIHVAQHWKIIFYSFKRLFKTKK